MDHKNKKIIFVVMGITIALALLFSFHPIQKSLIARLRGRGYIIPPPPYPLQFASDSRSGDFLARFIGKEYRIPPIPAPPLRYC